MKAIKSQVPDQTLSIEGRSASRIDAKVRDQICNQVEDKIWYQVAIQVWDQIWEEK